MFVSQADKSAACRSRVAAAGLMPVQRPVTRPERLSNTNATLPVAVGLNALRPAPTSFATSGMRCDRP